MSRRRFLCMYTSLVDSLLMRALPYLIFPIRTSSSAIMNRFVIYRPVDGAGRIRWSFTLFDCWSTLSPAKIHSSTESSFSLSLSRDRSQQNKCGMGVRCQERETNQNKRRGGGGAWEHKTWSPWIFFGGEIWWLNDEATNKQKEKKKEKILRAMWSDEWTRRFRL